MKPPSAFVWINQNLTGVDPKKTLGKMLEPYAKQDLVVAENSHAAVGNCTSKQSVMVYAWFAEPSARTKERFRIKKDLSITSTKKILPS